MTIIVMNEENIVDARAWVMHPIERKPDETAKAWRKRKFRARAFGHFCGQVKWPHPLSRMAEKLGLESDDPRLPEAALTLARAGKIVVYIDRNGNVSEYGKPRR